MNTPHLPGYARRIATALTLLSCRGAQRPPRDGSAPRPFAAPGSAPRARDPLRGPSGERLCHAARYMDDDGRARGARFVHARTGFVFDYLAIESAPQAMLYATTFPAGNGGDRPPRDRLRAVQANRVLSVGALLLTGACGGRAASSSPDASVAEARINACGGTSSLTFQGAPAVPADPCGPCLDGALVCSGSNLLSCDGALPASVCADASSTPDASMLPVDGSRDGNSTDATFADADNEYDGGPGWQNEDASIDAESFADGGASTVTCLDLTAQRLVSDPARTVLYASVAGTSPQLGNSVVRIDPSAVAITGTVFVGSQPNALAITDDSEWLYVGEDGTASVRRVSLPTGSVGPPVYLGTGQYGPYTAGDIRAVPGTSTQYVVSRRQYLTPDFAGLALYDGESKLSEWDSGGILAGTLVFAGPNTLYAGPDDDTTACDLSSFDLSGSSIQYVSDNSSFCGGRIASQAGWIFGENGAVFDVASGQVLASTYPAQGPVWPDPNGTDVWFLSQGTLTDFDRTTFTMKQSYLLPEQPSFSELYSLVGWSSTGFAFLTPTQVCVVKV